MYRKLAFQGIGSYDHSELRGKEKINYSSMLLATLFSSFTVTETTQLKPHTVLPERWEELWDLWEIRGAALLSLILQYILMVFGHWRKSCINDGLSIILWLAYSSADTIATFTLGLISNNSSCTSDSNIPLALFWTPFLLLHLGGPNTVSAYSLSDNDTWLRRLLLLSAQVAAAVYVIFSVWTNTALDFLTIPIFIAGIIKCAERTLALWHVSRDHFRDSLLPPPDPGPNYAKFMQEYTTRIREGRRVGYGGVIEPLYIMGFQDADRRVELLSGANYFFRCFKRLFADLILDFHDIRQSMIFMTERSYQEAFKVIELELGLFYNLFYTKAFIAYSLFGLLLRVFTFCCIAGVLAGFCITTTKGPYSNADVMITYVLLIGAIIIEVYAVIELLFSEQMLLILGKHRNSVPHKLYEVISSNVFTRHKWSNQMAQYNFIGFCLKGRPTRCSFIQRTLHIYDRLEKHRYRDFEVVPDNLKELVFQDLQKKITDMNSVYIDTRQICTHRGNWALNEAQCWDSLGWSIEVEFDQSILLWHIATDLCYYSDLNKDPNNNVRDLHYAECKVSRVVSNYMLYLMVMRPFMLPNGIGEIRWRDTCAEAIRFFEEFGPISDGINGACTMLFQVSTDILPSTVKGDRSKSVLFDACRLAKSLECVESERKWKLICNVWIEMLCYAASECRWSDHAEQLRRGGELLTHVWLLMAHLGITQQLQISAGHARVTLYDE